MSEQDERPADTEETTTDDRTDAAPVQPAPRESADERPPFPAHGTLGHDDVADDA